MAVLYMGAFLYYICIYLSNTVLTNQILVIYFSFKKLLTILEEGIANHELQSEPGFDCEIPVTTCYKDGEIYHVIKDMMDSSVGLTSSIALKRYRAIGELLYHNACELYSKISPFEASIRRHYFHVQPLDANQLQNWHNYLDFIELQGDFDWVIFHSTPRKFCQLLILFLCWLKSFIPPIEIGCETL